MSDSLSGKVAEDKDATKYPETLVKHCGRLPFDCDPSTFLGRPSNIDKTRRSAEGNYSRDYDRLAGEVGLTAPAAPSKTVALERETPVIRSRTLKVHHMEANLHRFYKKLDDFRFPLESLQSSAQQPKSRESDQWLHTLREKSQELHQIIPPTIKSNTVVYDAAAFLIRQGVLNVKDTPYVNVKQARALLHFAHWLQQRLSREWAKESLVIDINTKVQLKPLYHALIGGPGTGKTTTTKVINALLEHFLGPECMPQSAPTNTAARLLGGNTVDARYKLPRSTLISKNGGQLSDMVLKSFRRQWQNAQAQNIDEISMLGPDKFHQMDIRVRQATMRFEETLGGLATNGSVDFFQLPPVDAPSIAMPLELENYAIPEEFLPRVSDDAEKKKTRREAKWAEMQFGCRLWRESFRTVTSLTLNMRTTGILKDILCAMRAGEISDASWNALRLRVLGMHTTEDGKIQSLPKGVRDPRLNEPPFSNNSVAYIVHRHNLRACQSYCNAVRASLDRNLRLYVCVAADEIKKHTRDISTRTEDVRLELLKENNLRKLQYLPGILPMHRGMLYLLYSKKCVRLNLMHGCEVQLEDILFHDDDNDEDVPQYAAPGRPILLRYMPVCLLLRAIGAEWTLPSSLLPKFLDGNIDRKGLFLLYPETKYIKRNSPGEQPVNVRRTHFPIVPADARIVYGAQGESFSASVLDMALPPGMKAEVHWLANYVMLSRATSIEGILILRIATRQQLTVGAPQYLKDEVDRLLLLETQSVRHLRARIAEISTYMEKDTLDVLQELFECEEIGRRPYTLEATNAKRENIQTAESPKIRRRLRKKSKPEAIHYGACSTQLPLKAPRGSPVILQPPQWDQSQQPEHNHHQLLSSQESLLIHECVLPEDDSGATQARDAMALLMLPGLFCDSAPAAKPKSADERAQNTKLPGVSLNGNQLVQRSHHVDLYTALGYSTIPWHYEDSQSLALSNIGNTCYLNALLHTISRIPSVAQWTSQHKRLCSKANGNCILCDLAFDVNSITISIEKEFYVPRIVTKRRIWGGDAFDNFEQHDASEAFTMLLMTCDAVDLQAAQDAHLITASSGKTDEDIRYTTPYYKTFGGWMVSKLTCNCCPYVSSKHEIFHCLALAVPRVANTIEIVLANYWGPQPLVDADDKCEECRGKQCQSKDVQLSQWPRVLMLHLKRWVVVSQWPFQQRKNETTVRFNDTLEVPKKSTPYKLRAIVVHQGKAGSGHYIAYVRCADDRWYKCDDFLSPKLVHLSTVLLAEAYMLFYDA